MKPKKSSPGLFIVLEGTDGSGKSTQYKLLLERLKESGYLTREIKFPQYDKESSYFIRQYLSGNYGTAKELGPYTPSLFYALDRFDGAKQIRQWLDEGAIVLADRYIGANKAHQGQKIDDANVRREYYRWLDQLEFSMLGIPKPDLNIILSVKPEIANQLIADRSDQVKDIHDADPEHIRRSYETYQELGKVYKDEYLVIDCVQKNKLMQRDEINKLLWNKIKPLITKRGKNQTQNLVAAGSNPMVNKSEAGLGPTPEGQKWLEESVSNTTGNVYTFTDKISPITVSAAMARLSRRGDDMRVTLLEEFAGKDYDKQLLGRVITAFGDDSVQQLAGLHLVVENASNLLTKKLEWGRLAAYLEQSTRYIYFDQKDSKGNYRYFTPEMSSEMTKKYRTTMDEIFVNYAEIVHKLTDYIRGSSTVPKNEQDGPWKAATKAQACDAARGLLPVATTSTVGIYGSGQAIESLIMHLQSDELPEAKDVGQQILTEARKVLGVFLERADKPDRGGALIAYRAQTKDKITKLTDELLPRQISNDHQAVNLVNYSPRNEVDLVPYILYENSALSLSEIKREVASWSYDKKQNVLTTYFGDRLNRRHRPGRALENAHYSWDILCDYGIFRDLQRHRMVDDLNWQKLTPRYGYEIPKLIEDAGLSEAYEKCFDLSFDLYNELQKAGYDLESQYATLLGHKMRWKISYNAREAFHLHELRTSPQGHPGYRKLVGEMQEKLAQVHPLIAEGMKFVNKDEDPELTRLAAERYTQFKLDQLKDQ